jgi:hypothetical protein
VAKRNGVEKLTLPRALITELVRRYWVLGIDCSILEVQKLAWLLERGIRQAGLDDPLDLRFAVHRYGPYADRLRHLLDGLDGSYLHCDRRLSDAEPADVIWYDQERMDRVRAYLTRSDARPYGRVIEEIGEVIDGFQSPLGMELLATVGWLIDHEGCEPTVDAVKESLKHWPGGRDAGERKLRLFDDYMIELALSRLVPPPNSSQLSPERHQLNAGT